MSIVNLAESKVASERGLRVNLVGGYFDAVTRGGTVWPLCAALFPNQDLGLCEQNRGTKLQVCIHCSLFPTVDVLCSQLLLA